MAARSIGSATVSFGLVSIPVKIYTTTSSSSAVRFNLVHRDTGQRLKQQYVLSDGTPVDRSDIAKGYEFAKGQYVVLTNEEVKALDAVADETVALVEFVPEATLDPLLYDRAYYLGPDKGGDRAYHLLARAMRETDLVGIARYAARGKQYTVVLRPYESGLVMQQLHYDDELKSFEEVPIGDAPAINDSEVELAKQIIAQIAHDTYDASQYHDEVKERVLALIQQKVEGEEITATADAPAGQVIDLMEALKASLGASAAPAAEPQARKPAKQAPTSAKSKSTSRKRKTS